MQIIKELEPKPRGVYCGALGYVSYDGQMDTNIAIRTLLHAGNRLYCWAGGGIVMDMGKSTNFAIIDALAVDKMKAAVKTAANEPFAVRQHDVEADLLARCMGLGESNDIGHKSFHRAQQIQFGIDGSVVDEAEEIAKNMLAICFALHRLSMPCTHSFKQDRLDDCKARNCPVMSKDPLSVAERMGVFNRCAADRCQPWAWS